jgi:hypothetical protein
MSLRHIINYLNKKFSIKDNKKFNIKKVGNSNTKGLFLY